MDYETALERLRKEQSLVWALYALVLSDNRTKRDRAFTGHFLSRNRQPAEGIEVLKESEVVAKTLLKDVPVNKLSGAAAYVLHDVPIDRRRHLEEKLKSAKTKARLFPELKQHKRDIQILERKIAELEDE